MIRNTKWPSHADGHRPSVDSTARARVRKDKYAEGSAEAVGSSAGVHTPHAGQEDDGRARQGGRGRVGHM